MWKILLLVTALCTDSFVASIAYGANKVRVGKRAVTLVNLICSGALGAALCLGTLIGQFVPQGLTKAVCFVSLFMIGVMKLLDYSIKKYINKHNTAHKNISFSVAGLCFIVSIYGNPMEADRDHSKSLSMKEAAFLAFAMSIDSFVAGTLAAFLEVPIPAAVAACFVTGIIVMCAGLFIGKRVADKSRIDLSWLSGILLIALAFSKILF